MSTSTVARLGPWLIAAGAAALGLAGASLGLAAGQIVATVAVLGVMSVVYPAVGAFLASRAAGGTIGWLLLGAGIAMAILAAAGAYASAQGGGLPGSQLAAWVASWAFVPALALSGALLLFLFPTGSPPTRRWRPLVVVVTVAMVLAAIGYAFRPGRLAIGEPVANPLGVPPLGGLLATLAAAGDVLFPLAVAAGAASMVVRYRTAGTDERQQIKWFAYVAVIMAVGFGLATLPSERVEVLGSAIGAAALAALPLAVAVAVLRYRLYDIELLINRTLVYVSLIGILGGVYAAAITLLQRTFVALTGNTSDAAVVITTLVLAGLFTPVRKSLEATVDRRFKTAATGLDTQRAIETDGDEHAALAARLAALEARLARLDEASTPSVTADDAQDR